MSHETTLHINNAELQVFLGWKDDERQQKQTVLLDIDITFPETPKACLNDELNDTYCYATLLQTIHKTIANKPFKLIETLTYEIHTIIQSVLPADATVVVRLTKRPNIPNFNGSVCFSYGN